MKRIIIFPFTIFALHLPLNLNAQEILPSNQSFSGLIFTPNAQVLNQGNFSFTYSQGTPQKATIGDLDSLSFSLGLFPGMEANGRIVTKTYNTNLYTDSTGGIRDLSASFKYQIPQFWSNWGLLDGLNVAVGMQDVEGEANNFGAKYVVADYSFDFLPVRTSAGFGKTDYKNDILNGPFAGIEVQPLSFLQLSTEYDSVEYNVMAKLFTPDDLLPWNIQASLGFMVYTGHETEQSIWQTQFSMPLAGDYVDRETRLQNHLSLDDKLTLAHSKSDIASLTTLTQALEKEGFLNIRLGIYNNQLIIELENRRYNHDQVDGIGVALGIISSFYGEAAASELNLDSDRFTVIALHNQLPILKVKASASSYRNFIRTGGLAPDLEFDTKGLASVIDNTQWSGDKLRSSFGRTQVILSPGLRYAIATEYGVFDYSLALETNTYTSLWKGAALDVRYLTPLSNSDDYEDGLWQNSAYKNDIDRIQFHQTVNLPLDLRYQFSYGLVYAEYLGYKNDLSWYSPSGNHMLGAEYGSYSHKDNEEALDHNVILANYTYSRPEWNWQLNIKGGEFWNGDNGYQVTTNHWFGDVKVYASYLASKFEDSDKEQFLTMGVAFPLTLWRDMSPDYIQVRSLDEFNFSLQTRIGESHNNLNQGAGLMVPFQHSLEREYFNRGRYGSDYFENQTVRLRNAYLRWLDSQ